jgi:arrestin-related trafficking adapter 3/6
MPKLTASTPVTVVSCVGPDDDNELSNLVVERQWDEHLQYVVNMEGGAFPIGGTIPLNLVLMPLGKISIHRITAHLEGTIIP